MRQIENQFWIHEFARMQNRKSKCSYDLNHKFESLQRCRNTSGAKEKPKLTRRKSEMNTMWASMSYEFQMQNNTKAKKKVELLNRYELA